MAVAVSTHGVKMLKKEINELYGSDLIAIQLVRSHWLILMGDLLVRNTERTVEAMCYLEGVRDTLRIIRGKRK